MRLERIAKNSEPKATVVKAKAPSVTSSTNGLKGEAYLNSRREYWRKEIANNSSSYKNTSQTYEKKADGSNVFSNILGFIVGGAVLAFIAYVIVSGGGPLLVLFVLFIGAMMLKCM